MARAEVSPTSARRHAPFLPRRFQDPTFNRPRSCARRRTRLRERKVLARTVARTASFARLNLGELRGKVYLGRIRK